MTVSEVPNLPKERLPQYFKVETTDPTFPLLPRGQTLYIKFAKMLQVVAGKTEQGVKVSIPQNLRTKVSPVFTENRKEYTMSAPDLCIHKNLPYVVMVKRAFRSSKGSIVPAHTLLFLKGEVVERKTKRSPYFCRQTFVATNSKGTTFRITPECDGIFSVHPDEIKLFVQEVIQYCHFPCKVLLEEGDYNSDVITLQGVYTQEVLVAQQLHMISGEPLEMPIEIPTNRNIMLAELRENQNLPKYYLPTNSDTIPSPPANIYSHLTQDTWNTSSPFTANKPPATPSHTSLPPRTLTPNNVPQTAISITSQPLANVYTTAISQPNAHIVSWPLPPIPQASLFETQTSDRKLGHHISSVSENNSSLEYYETIDAYNDSGDDDYIQVSLPKSSSTSNESSEYAADNPTATGEMTAHSSSTLPKVKPRSKSLNEINSVGTPKEITESSTSIPAIEEERNESPSDEIGPSVTSCTPKPPVAKARSKFLSDGPPEGGVEISTPKSSETVHNVSPTPDAKLNTSLEDNVPFLKTLERGDTIQLLEGMNLREYKDAFESTATGEEITAHSSSMLPKVKPRSKSLNEINSVGMPKEITESSTSIPAIKEERNESPSDKNGDLGVTSCTPKPPVAKARSEFLSDGPPEGGVEFSTPKSSETVHNVSPTPDPKLNTNLEENLLFLKTLERGDIIQLLEGMNLGEYKDAFEREQINGELMSSLTEQMLTDDLQVAKSLHRLRLMMIISGQTSARQFLVEVDN